MYPKFIFRVDFTAALRIRDPDPNFSSPDPGSEFFLSRNPDPYLQRWMDFSKFAHFILIFKNQQKTGKKVIFLKFTL
jgi:hypothetical protein